ncbi:MAG: glycosyltransferase, partial [Sphingomonadaceae bacterium]
NVTGRLVRPGAISAFADALQHYCEDKDSRAAAGAAGRAASERFGWDAVNQELVDAYLRVVRQRIEHSGPPSQRPR